MNYIACRRISQLGSEILFIQNMIDDSVLLGELDMMFTTLQVVFMKSLLV